MSKAITMQDIANEIGVSKVTVSKALSDKDGVSEELKERIKTLAVEMGYRFNASASSIKSGLSYNVGVIIPERFTGSYNSFYLMMYQQLTREFDNHKYATILHMLTDIDEENLKLPNSYFDRKVDAFIILGQVSSDYVDLLKGADVPFLFLDFYEEHTEVDSVIADNFYGSYCMTNYLISNNHSRIAFVGSIGATSSIQDRYLGYYKSLIEHGIKLNHHYVIEDRDEAGKFIPVKLPEDLPTAFVCNCDRMAYNLIEQLADSGIKVPDDVSVVGFDNDIYSTLSKPPITTVDVNVAEMTRTASNMMIDKIKDQNKTFGRVLIKGSNIIRESVKTL